MFFVHYTFTSNKVHNVLLFLDKTNVMFAKYLNNVHYTNNEHVFYLYIIQKNIDYFP